MNDNERWKAATTDKGAIAMLASTVQATIVVIESFESILVFELVLPHLPQRLLLTSTQPLNLRRWQKLPDDRILLAVAKAPLGHMVPWPLWRE